MSEELRTDEDFDLRWYVTLILHRKWIVLGFTAALCVLVGAGTALQPKVYEARSSVLSGVAAPRLLDFDPIPQDRFRERGYGKTQGAILTSRWLLQRAVKRLIGEGFYGEIPPQEVESRSMGFAKDLQISKSVQALTATESQVTQISVQGRAPEWVARLANVIAEEYVASDLEEKQRMASHAVAWLQTKLNEAEVRLKESQAELQTFRDKQKITAADETDSFASLNFARLNDEYLTAHIQRMQMESRIEALRKARAMASDTGAASAAQSLQAVIRKQMRESLQKEYVEGELRMKDLSQRYGDQYPDIVALRAKLAKLERELQALEEAQEVPGWTGSELRTANLAELELEHEGLVSKENFLVRTLEAHKADARNLSRTGIAYALLKQNVDLADKTYNDLLSKLNTARLSGELKTPSVQILDQAEVPEEPISPQPARNLAVAVLLGLALGVGLVLLMDNLDRRVKNPQDATRHLKLPLLTVVPGTEQSQTWGSREGQAQLVTIVQPKSHAAECYRNLRTSILFSSGKPIPRTILVTSAVAGEGKSTTAANLAVVMAQNGRKTLLIDADLRQPALHRYFTREAGRGIDRLLQGGCRVEEAVQPSGIEGLDILLCSEIPSNPSELLGSDRMLNLIDTLRSGYEVIIIDSPVVISVPDAVILATRCEAVVLVHRPGATDRAMVQHALRKLDEVKANILGLVFNNVDVKAGGYQYAEYVYYGYGAGPGTKARRAKVRRA